MPKAGSDYTCLVVMNVDSALKKDENYHPQAFWKRMQIHWKRSTQAYSWKYRNFF